MSPSDGKRPWSRRAWAEFQARRARYQVDFGGPEARPESEGCIESGAGPPFENSGANDNYQFVQTREQLAIEAEWEHEVPIVRIGDKRHAPPSVRFLSGDSIGWWEGRTLAIETTHFLPRDVTFDHGDADADERVVERLTRLPPTSLLYEFQVSNPHLYSQSWRGEMILQATRGPIFEYACHEGNDGLANILRAGRRLDASSAAPLRRARRQRGGSSSPSTPAPASPEAGP